MSAICSVKISFKQLLFGVYIMSDELRSVFFNYLSGLENVSNVNEIKYGDNKTYAIGNFVFSDLVYSYFYATDGKTLSVVDVSLGIGMTGFEKIDVSEILGVINSFNESRVGIKLTLKHSDPSLKEVNFGFSASIMLPPEDVIGVGDVFKVNILPSLTILEQQPITLSDMLVKKNIIHDEIKIDSEG